MCFGAFEATIQSLWIPQRYPNLIQTCSRCALHIIHSSSRLIIVVFELCCYSSHESWPPGLRLLLRVAIACWVFVDTQWEWERNPFERFCTRVSGPGNAEVDTTWTGAVRVMDLSVLLLLESALTLWSVSCVSATVMFLLILGQHDRSDSAVDRKGC